MLQRIIAISNFSVQHQLTNTPKEWLFEGFEKHQHLTERSAQIVFERDCDKAGIKKKVSIHSLRHSFDTLFLESGTDIRCIQKLLGHSSTEKTMIYTHVNKKYINNIQNSLDIL